MQHQSSGTDDFCSLAANVSEDLTRQSQSSGPRCDYANDAVLRFASAAFARGRDGTVRHLHRSPIFGAELSSAKLRKHGPCQAEAKVAD